MKMWVVGWLLFAGVFTFVDVYLYAQVKFKLHVTRLSGWPGSGFYLRWKHRKEF